MKVVVLNIIFLIVLLVLAFTMVCKGQDTTACKKADFANWVIESNLNSPKQAVIKFYNAKQELIYQEEIKDRRINVARAKVRNALNQVLAQLVERNDNINTFNLVAVTLKEH